MQWTVKQFIPTVCLDILSFCIVIVVCMMALVEMKH